MLQNQSSAQKIHFIGIGGIGLSGLARYLKAQGYDISGSDMSPTLITKELSNEAIEVTIPHNDRAIDNQDIIVLSKVIPSDNAEVIKAQKEGLNILSRKDFLPFVTRDKKVYSVCGAHGKSTTTAILASIIKDSSAIIGAESKEFKSNMRFCQESDLLIFEADESDGSFLNTNPYCAIVTNAEPEHMENYNYDYDEFYNSYKRFIQEAKSPLSMPKMSF